jgi:hypothetical protein
VTLGPAKFLQGSRKLERGLLSGEETVSIATSAGCFIGGLALLSPSCSCVDVRLRTFYVWEETGVIGFNPTAPGTAEEASLRGSHY